MAKTLEERKTEVLEQLMAVDGARRGQLSQQYYTCKNANGQKVQQGPYYVWQRYVKGKKRSVRVPADQIERVKVELKQGHEVDAILDELWDILEESVEEQDLNAKKSPGGKEYTQARNRSSPRPDPRKGSRRRSEYGMDRTHAARRIFARYSPVAGRLP